tara:strand:- start:276 stop:446 length:171 start_codon:yes stop_codon:yes gene_type:complete
MTVVDYDLGYYEGVRNVYRMMQDIYLGKELEEVLDLVREEMKNALAIHKRTKEEYE